MMVRACSIGVVALLFAPFMAPHLVASALSYTTIDFPGALDTEALGINNSGQIVGVYQSQTHVNHGFLLDGSVFTTIDPPGSTSTFATGINDSGQIVGSYVSNGMQHGYLLSGSVLTTIDPPGSLETFLWGINNSGQVVGWHMDTTGPPFNHHGFLWDGGVFTAIDFPGARTTERQRESITAG